MMVSKNVLLVGILLLIGGGIYYLETTKSPMTDVPATSADIPPTEEVEISVVPPTPSDTAASDSNPPSQAQVIPKAVPTKTIAGSGNFGRAKEFVHPTGFSNTTQLGLINTEVFTVKQFIAKKVILIDFWTYSCINCQRTTPYLNEWHKKYKDKGLLIVGVHTPEFAFERDKNNVDSAIAKFNIKYPVVLDNEYGTWNAYSNRYWPAKYLIDIDGNIVYRHFGEGSYAETEKKIQELLEARDTRLGIDEYKSMAIEAPEDAMIVESGKVKSPEIYFGATRNEHLGIGTPLTLGQQDIKAPTTALLNKLYLVGSWKFAEEYASNMTAGGKIIFRYSAKNVYMVLGALKQIKVRVTRDGSALPTGEAGKDILFDQKTGESYFYVSEERLYDVVKGANYGEHTLEFTIDEGGLQAFTFTFG